MTFLLNANNTFIIKEKGSFHIGLLTLHPWKDFSSVQVSGAVLSIAGTLAVEAGVLPLKVMVVVVMLISMQVLFNELNQILNASDKKLAAGKVARLTGIVATGVVALTTIIAGLLIQEVVVFSAVTGGATGVATGSIVLCLDRMMKKKKN